MLTRPALQRFRGRLVVFVCALLLAGAGSAEVADESEEPQVRILTEHELGEDDYELRLSLPTEEDRAAWAQPGFRVSLGLASGPLNGTGPSPDLSPISFTLRPSVRLDEWWSISASFTYGASFDMAVQGIRWSATAGPTFHPWRGLGISLGIGFGGLDLWRQLTDGERPRVPGQDGSSESVSRTLGPDERLERCGGTAWTGLARLEYLMVAGPLFATGPFAQADLQWTRCESPVGGINIDTGQPIVGRQWWRHRGGSFGWWLTWR